MNNRGLPILRSTFLAWAAVLTLHCSSKIMTSPTCGNGIAEANESCDDGPNNGAYGFCAADCKGPGFHCGDGIADVGVESCDDGTANGKYGFCAVDCQGSGPNCGDGLVDPTFEACDSGVEHNGAYGFCSADCRGLGPRCGDGVVDSGFETCDGNCPAECKAADSCQAGTPIGSPATCDVECAFTPIDTCGPKDGCCPSGCTFCTTSGCGSHGDLDCPSCDPAVGVSAPLPVCSVQRPCEHVLNLPPYNGETLTTSIDVPTCHTTDTDRIGLGLAYDDGAPKTWVDEDGLTRYHCEYRGNATALAPRPLVIFVPGSGGNAANAYDYTRLREKAITYDLNSSLLRHGFVLVSIQARNLHWPTADNEDGPKSDTYHRDLATHSTNRDITYLDHVVDSIVSEGVIEASRIYLMGWSNGARFAAMYAIARHDTPTPGGNYVAAVANYSGGDPFENVSDGFEPSCKLNPYPTSTLPLFMVSRSCDGVACDENQHAAFHFAGMMPTPGNIAETWMQTLKFTIGDPVSAPDPEWKIIDDDGATVLGCDRADLCGRLRSLVNHCHWPDGIDDGGGVDSEPDMLDFLRTHERL
jgi:dienelactone hydrolase